MRRWHWRLGLLEGQWRLRRTDPSTGVWSLLDDALDYRPDLDVVEERRRVVVWSGAVLGVRRKVLQRSYDSPTLAYDIVIQG